MPSRLTIMNLPIKLVAFSAAAVFLQTTNVPPLGDLTGPLERMTLVGVLLMAVQRLWASNAAKDKQLLDMSARVTETMALVMESVKELRKATEEIGSAMDNLASNIAALPCSMSDIKIERAEAQDLLAKRGTHGNR